MKKSSESWIVLTSLCSTGFWIVLISHARVVFLNSRMTDPLAMIHALFPSFWLLLLVFLGLSMSVVLLAIDKRWIHLLLLFQISLVLYYTPWVFSGYSFNPDTLWFTKIGMSMPDVLSGKDIWLSSYGEAFPLSFVMTFVITEITGADAVTFSLYIYPLFGVAATSLLGYALASRFLDSRNAFVSMLFVLPALHYWQVSVCPRFPAFMLTLTIMVLLLRFDRRSTAIALALFFPLVMTHASSAVLLGGFILSMLIYKSFTRETKITFTAKSLLLLAIGWLSWITFHVVLVQETARIALHRVLNLEFSTGFEVARRVTSLGGSFVYPEVGTLTLIVYASYLIIPLALLFSWFTRLKHTSIVRLNMRTHNLTYKKLVPAISALLFVPLSYAILLGTTQTYDELQRGLFFFILMASICVGSYNIFSRKPFARINKRTFATLWLVFVFLSFPIISYSIAAYNVLLPSEGAGMTFVGSYIPLNGKMISTFGDQQLVAFVNSSEDFTVVRFPPDLNETNPDARARNPDVIVLRSIGYFRIAMRFDLSFKTNRFILLQDKLKEDVFYDTIYSSPTFEIYSR